MNTRLRALLPRLAIALSLTLLLGACQTAYYSTMEKFGIEKRDILVDRVEDARESQAEAKQQFESALAEFMAVTNYEGGDLEAHYDRLSQAYEDSEDKATAVRERIEKVESVAAALFEEWQAELQQYSNAGMRQRSTEQLRDTRGRYQKLIDSMNKAEQRIAPVLAAFRDRVLYLKHNLNARAIGALRGDVAAVRADVGRLIDEMQASIAEADAFIESMASE